MVYVKSILIGLLLAWASFWFVWAVLWFPVTCLKLGFCGLDGIHYDLRGVVDYFPFTSICAASAIFVAGFGWSFRRSRRRAR